MPQRGPQLAVANAVSRGFAPVLASLYSFAMAHTSPSLPPTAADHALLQALTIIVPTYNRPAALARLLAYWAPLPVQLIVVDGSDQPAALPCRT